MKLTKAESNYLKTIYELWEQTKTRVSTTRLASALGTSPAAVTDGLQRLAQKKLIQYKKYAGVLLSPEGKSKALQVLRRQRLWEVWLIEKLNLDWEEASQLSKQLAVIHSVAMCNRLAAILDDPTHSPFGAPIPDENGAWAHKSRHSLDSIPERTQATIVAFQEHSKPFLEYLKKKGIFIGSTIEVVEKLTFDQSLDILVDNKDSTNISEKVSQHILVVF